MFVLAELKDTIRIPPEMFHMKLVDAVKDEINRKLANKVSKKFIQKLKRNNRNFIRFCLMLDFALLLRTLLKLEIR